MRGHGFAAAAGSLIDVVRLSVYLPRNASVLMNALALDEVTPLSAGEIGQRQGGETYGPQSQTTWRAWEYWAHRAGCTELLGKPET
jgi:ribulose-5-phosphate 4-epimerase/fuculose-1-phosphate aldolase